jgi:cholesterol transport system auxiliary component
MRTIMNRHLLRLLAASFTAALAAGCASQPESRDTLFDFGPAAPRAGVITDAPLPTLVVTEATGSTAFDSERMFYRLNYADSLQSRAYANSRWSTNPLDLVTRRLKSRLAQTGTKVLQATDASPGVPILRVEVDDFIHAFASSSQSEGRVVVRASLFQGHVLVDQQTFSRTSPSPNADAGGGARALAASTDAVAADIAAWLARLNLPKR